MSFFCKYIFTYCMQLLYYIISYIIIFNNIDNTLLLFFKCISGTRKKKNAYEINEISYVITRSLKEKDRNTRYR